MPRPWWTKRVFYEAFVRSFADSDGDGIGDLAGLTARLDALNDGDPSTATDLGATGLWLMPIFDSPSYHGYDVVDYERVDPDYGDLDDLQALLGAAHRRGMKVILDLVVNHTSRQHPWFQDALAGGAHRDWYIWSETNPAWPAVAGGSPWHQSPAGDWYYGAFWEGMPDLDLRRPDVTDEVVRIAASWLDLGVDGFRIDAAKHLIETGPRDQVNTPETLAWLRTFRGRLHADHPEALVLGEVYDPRAITLGYVTEGSLDLVFDFGVGPAAIGAARLGDPTTLTANLREVAERYPAGSVASFLTNHDQARVMSELRGDVAGAGLAAAALLTGPGVPFVYYGEELGMEGAKPDERIRTPFPWTADGPGHGFTTGTPWEAFGSDPESVNAALQAADPGSLRSAYRDLIRLRADQPELVTGAVIRLEASRADVAATLRASEDGTAIVIQNLGPNQVRDLALTLDEGPLCGRPRAALAYATDGDLGRLVAPPEITPTGGLDGYVALSRIPGRSTVVIDLTP
ncbi:MAG TPA: alpha-amylase family glycosyl hydrolase [Candidatus Sulfomarinibacteraceae bacterium]|nr:alpha-amylase family glycosyl hydrolase [Candidatus Sulfomarinibacteraceae bacterium]